MSKENLVIVPVGNPVDKFIKMHNYRMKVDHHWRWKNEKNNYHILAIQYGDYVPEDNTYDTLLNISGYKWEIIKNLNKYFDLSKWKYVGIFDDDVILDQNTLNTAFDFASTKNLSAFQISLENGSESNWKSTRNIANVKYSYTNFIEIMCPIFDQKSFTTLNNLLKEYDVKTGWGIDYVLSELLQQDLVVLHFLKMFHPSRPNTGSSYNKHLGFEEMEKFLFDVFPKHMKKMNRTVEKNYRNFSDQTLNVVFET